MRFIASILTIFALLAPGARAATLHTRVVLIVWDGMRPDFISEKNTPTLYKLAHDGVMCKNHHSVYLSATEVNGTALATGVYPDQSGIVGNWEFRPDIDPGKDIQVEELSDVRKGDEITGGHYLGYPTVAEILHEHGLHTDIAGTKPVALLHDRAERLANALGTTVFAGQMLPEAIAPEVVRAVGKFPPVVHNNKIANDLWTTKVLTEPLWNRGIPVFSLLWLGEPDYSQHATGPGSPASLAAIKSDDQNLARVLAALKKHHVEDITDLIIVSDHGFSTVSETPDMVATLNKNGFHAFRQPPGAQTHEGEIIVVSNSGSVLLYVTGHDQTLTARIVHCLQAQPYTGAIFTRQPVEGAFTLADAKIDASTAPDIVVSMRWKPDVNKFGAPGLIDSEGNKYAVTHGTHVSLSPYDMHNVCVASGPDFKNGFVDALPSGNIDIAPTILWILGIEPKQKMSGRVLSEVLVKDSPHIESFTPHHREATWQGDKFLWRQYLNYSEVNGVRYFDEGNGEQIPLEANAKN